ncbi:hypothetical protein MMC10_003512 [Thelotrema lepadinum]|nr:hypothetical protein [Thelotrema lepadinum]
MLDAEGNVAGTVLVDGKIAAGLDAGNYEFIALSRTTAFKNSEDVSWDADEHVFLKHPEDRQNPAQNQDISDSDDEPINPEMDREAYKLDKKFRSGFDSRIYDKNKYWCLYNVLLIRWNRDRWLSSADTAERIGIGKVHVDAFDKIAKRKEIVLA